MKVFIRREADRSLSAFVEQTIGKSLPIRWSITQTDRDGLRDFLLAVSESARVNRAAVRQMQLGLGVDKLEKR